MNTVDKLSIKLQNLKPENQQILLAFAEFLLAQQADSIQISTSKQRVLGLHKSIGWMSDDFNDSLI